MIRKCISKNMLINRYTLIEVTIPNSAITASSLIYNQVHNYTLVKQSKSVTRIFAH